MGEAAVVLAPERLPPVDRVAAQEAAEERSKERKRRERTRLQE
jgi:hypothetical protein